MSIGLFGPDPEQVERWAGLGVPIGHHYRFEDATEEDWSTFDAVLLDLQLLRVGTSGPDVDVAEATDLLQAAARRNRDAFWLLITPPALVDPAHRLARNLAEQLQAGLPATEVVSEPHQVASVTQRLRGWIDEIVRIEAIPLHLADLRELAHAELRCIRRLLSDCDSAELGPLGNGQSDAVVIRADCQIDGGVAPPRVLKLGPVDAIMREHLNYLEFARNRVGLGRYPHHDTTDVWRAGTVGAASYSFTGDIAAKTLAEVMDDGDGSPALRDLWGHVMTPWLTMREASSQSLAAFIDTFLWHAPLDQIADLWADGPGALDGAWDPVPWLRDIARRVNDVHTPSVIAHGDLHAYNVLVDADNRAWLIDFYHTGRAPGVFDFAYLDVMLMLHRVPNREAPVHLADAVLLAGEHSYYEGGDTARPEQNVVRSAALELWGDDIAPFLHLARACCALHALKYESTDKALAKAVASLAAAQARFLQPEWETAPEVAPIVF